MDNTRGARQVKVMFLVVSASMGGAETHALSLAKGLDRQHFDVSLVYLKDEAEAPQAHARVQDGVFVFCLGAERRLDFPAACQLGAYAAAKEIDIVVCVNPYPMIYAYILRLMSRRKLRIVEILHATESCPKQSWFRILLLRPLFWMADLLVFVCKNQGSYWERYMVSAGRTELVRHCTDLDRLRIDFPLSEKSRFRQALGFADGDYVVGVCGTLRHEKEHTDLVKAIHAARAAGTVVKCLFIGDGPIRAALESLVERLELQEIVKTTGPLLDARLAISCCDVIAMPSPRETVSIVAIESMAMGKPLIMADGGNASDLVEHGTNGLLYAPSDLAELNQHIQTLSDHSRRTAFGSASLAKVDRQFTLARMVDAYHRIFLALDPRPD